MDIQEVVKSLLRRIGEVHDTNDLWSHFRRDPDAFVTALTPVLEKVKAAHSEEKAVSYFFVSDDKDATKNAKRAWLLVNPSLMVRRLELPTDAYIGGACFSHNQGLPMVELLVEHPEIPEGAHKVNVRYTVKPNFDCFTQLEPIPEES